MTEPPFSTSASTSAIDDEVAVASDHEPELSPSVLRDLVVEGGLDVLERDGLSLGARTLSYARVFDHLERNHGIKVSRASVHERIWASHADFRRDVIGATIGHLPTDVLGHQADQLRAVADAAATVEPELRMAELARRLGPVALHAMLTMPGYREAQVAKAVAAPPQDSLASEVLHGPIRARSHAVLSTFAERLAAVTGSLGLRPRPTTGLDRYASHDLLGTLVINLLTGALLDANAGSHAVVQPLAFRGPTWSEDAPWTMVGVGLLAFLELLFEPTDRSPRPDLPLRPAAPPPPVPRIDGGDGSRRSRQELRQIVLTAGVEVLLDERLDLRPESLGYVSVFDHIERKQGVRLFRASVHNRIWESHDHYWLDVLTRAIQIDPNVSKQAVDELLAYQPATRPDGSVHVRQAAMDILRLVIGAETVASRQSPDFQRRLAIQAGLLTEPDSELVSALREAVRTTGLERVAAHSAALEAHLVSLGFEIRPELGIDLAEALRILVTLSLTTGAGSVFDQLTGVEGSGQRFPLRRADDPDRTDAWPAGALATWACFDLLFREIGSTPA